MIERKTQAETRMERFGIIKNAVKSFGSYEDRGYRIETDILANTVTVRELMGGWLVAYSSTKADYEQSLEEFILDFMV